SENLELRFEGAYSDINRDFVNDSSVVDQQGNYDGTFVETIAEGSLWENDLTASVGTDNVKFLAGLEASIQTMNFRNYIFSRSQFGVFEQTTDLDSLDLKEEIYSAFIHADINGGVVSSSLEKFSLVLGSRLADHNEFGTHWTYEINPKIQISNSALIYGAISTGFNAPSLYQLNSPEQGAGESFSIGNGTLEPEESTSYELGWKQELGNTADFEISLYRTEVDNVIEYVYLWDGNTPVENLTSMDNVGDTYLNISNQEINGIEIGVNLRPSSKFLFGGNLALTESTLHFSPDDIDATYTNGNHVQIFESGEFVTSEKELEGLTRRPSASALLQAEYRPVEPLAFKVTSRFVDSRDDIFYSADLGPFGAQDRSKVDGYNLTDFSIRYRVNNNLSVMGKIENVFDTDYVEINGFNTRDRSFFIKAQYRLGSM
ncbi:MAG: TonB-dependent receptor domain-containing protein, partial [Candidatus Cyclobacteriaceae bacterium M2_1C_046]